MPTAASLRDVLLAVALIPMVAACAARPATPDVAPAAPTEFRVVVPTTGEVLGMEAMVAALSRADVIAFGEQHDDPGTHRAEAALLDLMGRSNRPVVVSLEMFERDVQPALDAYLAGRISEGEFLATSRPWPNYASDYRPLVEMAKARGWPVIASNVPRPLASAVGRQGLAMLDTLQPAAEIVVERRLHVALEHLERDHHRPADAPQALEHRRLGTVGLRVIVLLAEEDDIGAGEAVDHRLESELAALVRRNDPVSGD